MVNENNYKWNLNELYSTEREWNEEYKTIEDKCIDIYENLDNFEENELIKTCGELLQKRDKLYAFIKLKRYLNSTQEFNNQFIEMDKLNSIISKIMAQVNDRIINKADKIILENTNYIKKFIKNNRIVNYKKAKPIISEMTQAQSHFFDISFRMVFVNASNNIPQITLNSIGKYLATGNRYLRKSIYNVVEDKYREKAEEFEYTLYKYIKSNIELKKILGYNSCLQASLEQESIDITIYNECINYINTNKNNFHDFFQIKKDLLKVDILNLYDLSAQIGVSKSEKITFEEAKRIIIESLKVLGDEYIRVVEKAFNENWIDASAMNSKRMSAFSYNLYGVHPYVFLNFQDDLNYIFTMAHEIGHAVHYYFANNSQNYFNAQLTSINSEISAMVNECLIYKFLIEMGNENKLKILMANLDKYRIMLCKQAILNEFENNLYTEINNNEDFKLSQINIIYRKVLKEYYGDLVKIDDEVYEWARVIHLYKGFHIYKYIISFCTAVSISNHINEKKNKYIQFLKDGGLKDIKNLLKDMGIDLYKDDIYKETFQEMNKLLKEIKRLCQ